MMLGLKDKQLIYVFGGVFFVYFFFLREQVNLTNMVAGLRVIWEQSMW